VGFSLCLQRPSGPGQISSTLLRVFSKQLTNSIIPWNKPTPLAVSTS
jgi:hypothetical protein